MKNIILLCRKDPKKSTGRDLSYGPYFTVRFTHQGVMADNDLVLVYLGDQRRWDDAHNPNYSFVQIDIAVASEYRAVGEPR